MRVPVVSKEGKPLMPTKPSRARRWLKQGKAVIYRNDLQQFAIQLTESSGEETQPISVGIDPGKLYSGVAVQSAKETLYTAHLELPFQRVKDRMETRRMMRRGRRGRRINRKLPFKERAHRQKRFNNRKKQKLPPSIKANKQLEYRVVKKLSKLFPISSINYETVKAKGDNNFSPVMVGQKVMSEQWLTQIAPVKTFEGWQTSVRRQILHLEKDNEKEKQVPETHAVDAIALASQTFLKYKWLKGDQGWFEGNVEVTNAPFSVIKRPPYNRRQLHTMIPKKGGIRKRHGGTSDPQKRGFYKGDFVEYQGKTKLRGWVSGFEKDVIKIADFNWKSVKRATHKKIKKLKPDCKLLIKCQGRTDFFK